MPALPSRLLAPLALLALWIGAGGGARAVGATAVAAPCVARTVAPQAANAAPEAPARSGSVVVPIVGPLSEEMVALTVRSIRLAHQSNARAIVFEIDTEGGEVTLMDRLIDEIEKAGELQTVAYVTQKAASAGSLIAISCQRLYMAPGSNMGSALVIMMPQLFGVPIGGAERIGGEDDALFKKLVGHYRAHWRAKAQANGRPAALAEAFVYAESPVYEVEVDGDVRYVTQSELDNLVATKGEEGLRRLRTICEKGAVLNLTAQEAFEVRMIDGLAVSRADLLTQLGLASGTVTAIEPSWSERLVGFLQSFGLLFLIGGMIAIFVEIKLPGFGLPGILGALLLGLWMFGKYLAGLAEVTELLLIAFGFALIAVEIFLVPGTMVAGVCGALGVVAGLVMAAQQTLLPESDRPYADAAWWSTTQSLTFGLVASCVGMIALAILLPRIPFLNRAILRPGTGAAPSIAGPAGLALDAIDPSYRPALGARGVALTVLRPAGKVVIDGRELDAVSDGDLIEAGRAIEVVTVEPGRLVVRARAATA